MTFVKRAPLLAGFALLVTAAAWQDLWPPKDAARVEIVTEGHMPARLYLFRDDRPFRLAPVDAVLPIRSDTYYRDRYVSRVPNPRVLEITARDQLHYLLLKGEGAFFLPPGNYRVEAYRGFFYTPAVERFTLAINDNKRIVLKLKPWEGVNPNEWITADDHIHLTRARNEDPVFLDWLAAEDLTVANFLVLQRQIDAAAQYGFGKPGEARRNGYVIRSGQELRNEFWGHTNVLGARELIRPMSTGLMYGNSPESWPLPEEWFRRGRQLGGLAGHAHLFQLPQHSSFYLDAALGHIDFVEVFQFGVMKTEPWYEFLNAGLRVTGVAGSDFPVYLDRKRPWPAWLPLLGPERAMVKATPGENSFASWAKGVREGKVVLSNGPLVEMAVDGATGRVTATAAFWRPLEALEIVRNGEVVAARPGAGARQLTLSYTTPKGESAWVAARVRAQTLPDEPPIQAHTNPHWLLEGGKPVRVEASRRAVAAKWQAEADYFRGAGIVFPDGAKQRYFLEQADRALAALR